MKIDRIENEYMAQKKLIENAQKTIEKVNNLNTDEMTEQQIQARNRVISSNKEDIKEYAEILKDIKKELIDAHNNGVELSETMKKELNITSDKESEELKQAINNYDFVGVVCEDGHEHTVKAFGEICGTPFTDFEDELGNQMAYVKKISKGLPVQVVSADTVEEAVEKDILEDTGDEDENTRYWVK